MFVLRLFSPADDSDDDREVSKKVRQVRQAASKAVSKQREMLLGDGGSEDEDREDDEQAFMDRKPQTLHWISKTLIRSGTGRELAFWTLCCAMWLYLWSRLTRACVVRNTIVYT